MVSAQLGVLFRYDDISGVSGTDVVAEVAKFSSGKYAVAWLGKFPSVAVWDSSDLILGAHGHGGATVIRWSDGEEETGPRIVEEP